MLAMVLHVVDQDVVVDVPDPDMVADGDAVLENLIRDWEQSRQRLCRFLDGCAPEDLRMPMSYHVVAGPLRAIERLRLSASHFNYHRRPIDVAIENGK
jgi:hypothetical protein